MIDEMDAIIEEAGKEGPSDQLENADQATPAMATVVATQLVNKTKKRKAQQATAGNSKADLFRWNQELIEALLTARSEHRKFFMEAKNKAKLNDGWKRVILDITMVCGNEPSMASVKNKYQSLQALYRKTCQEDLKTGNFAPIPKPLVWEAMVDHFGGRQGTAHDCLNTQSSPKRAAVPVSLSDGNDSDEEPQNVLRKVRRQGITPDRNSAICGLGDSIKEGLNTLGAGLGRMGNAPAGGANNLERLLTLHTELLQENKSQTAELLKLASSAFDFFVNNRAERN